MSSNGTAQQVMSASTTVVVRFSECDPLGIVWHGNYTKYLEDGRDAFGKKYGLDFVKIYNEGYATPIINIQIDFRKMMIFRDTALVEVSYRKTDAAKIIFDYIIKSSDTNEVICKASTTQVFVSKEGNELMLVSPDTYTNWKMSNGLL